MTHIDSKKINTTLFYISVLLLAINHKQCSQRKVKLLTKQPQQLQILKCVCSRPMTPGKDITLCGSHIHLNMNVSVFVCYLPIGTLSTLMGGFLAVRQ